MAEVTHKLTLSTTEHTSNGLLKFRQADDETQVLSVQLTESGKIKPFIGLKPFFCLMAREITGQGVSEEPVAIFSQANGTLKHTLSANAFQMVGRNEAYYSFRRESANGKWIEQFSTRSFEYIVEKSIYTQPFKDSNYFWTFKELYQQFLNYQDSGKTSFEDYVDSIKDMIQNIDSEGLGVLVDEIINAQGDFDSLGDRLETMETNLFAQDYRYVDANQYLEIEQMPDGFNFVVDGMTTMKLREKSLVIAPIGIDDSSVYWFKKEGETNAT